MIPGNAGELGPTGHPRHERLIADDVAPVPGLLAISTISLAELHFGVLFAKDEAARARRLQRLSAVLRRFDPLPLDGAVAESYGAMAAAVATQGRQEADRWTS